MNGATAGAKLVDATARLFEATAAGAPRGRAGEWRSERWAAVAELGVPIALADRAQGGMGLSAQQALRIVTLTGQHAVPLPLAETMIANHALAAAGLPLAAGPAAIVPDGVTLMQEGNGWRVAGTAIRVPWGRDVGTLVIETGGCLIRLTSGWKIETRNVNAAGMVRDTLTIDAAASAADVALVRGPGLLLGGATIRTLQMAGAVGRMVDLTAAHVRDRIPFGRTASKLPAIEHRLERAAEQAVATLTAADMAVDGWAALPDARRLAISAARVRAGDAVRDAITICQQIHTAIGSTQAEPLQPYMPALLGWRDEYGGDVFWSRILGQAALAAAPKGYWSFLHAA